jgi:transcriptional regulator with XRE-family HTH domain
MKNAGITQTYIANKNNLKSPTIITRVCNGEYNVTKSIRNYFLNCGLDLDKISDPDYTVTLQDKHPQYKKVGRTLTPEETQKLYSLIESKHLKQADIARRAYTSYSLINNVIKGKYRVTDLIKEHFKLSNINLDDIMVKD